MKVFLVLATCLVVYAAATGTSEWEQYKKDHGKVYKNIVEERQRFSNFMSTKAKIEAHNLKYENGEVTFKMGLNKLSDMTNEEYRKTMTTYRRMQHITPPIMYKFKGLTLPETVDWRQQNIVTGVKDQGQCGACWAFSTTGSIESQNALIHGNLISMSEQQLVDCCTDLWGCEGGNIELAYTCVAQQGGIVTEDSYQYEARDDTCRFNSANVVANLWAYVQYQSGNEDALLEGVADAGPISVAIDASHDSFQSYSSGVYYEPSCSTSALDHAVLAVGYGNENGQDYWLVKNSWGTGWGEQGYIKMSRNQGNNCGIATDASYPLID